MSKKSKDAALDYLNQLGICPAKNMQEVRAQMIAAVGEADAKRLWRQLHQESPGAGAAALSALANRSPETGLALTAAIDGDILRKICHWVVYHKKLFGSTVLDVGCGCGILTCFLAMQLPGARVVGADPRQDAVDRARQLAGKLGVKNVAFRRAAAAELRDQTYETVFSFRTLGEKPGVADADRRMLLLNTQADQTAEALSGYAGELAALTAQGGRLISFEPGGRSPRLLGWLYALSDSGFGPAEQYQKELLCQTADAEKMELSVTVAVKGVQVGREDAYRLFTAPFAPLMKQNKYVMEGAEAAVYLQNTLGELVEGYNIRFEDGTWAARMGLWTHRLDPSLLLSEQQAAGSRNKLFLSLTEKREAEIRAMRGDIHQFLRRGMEVRAMTYENGREGETDLPEEVK